MMLSDLCEPVFAYVCTLNRMGRLGRRPDFTVVRAEVKKLLSDAKARAESAGLGQAWPRAELALTFFVDSMILNSKLQNATVGVTWKPLSEEIKKLGFEEEFWIILEDTLRDPSDSATQTLSVFYTCIGLGFVGIHLGQPGKIRTKQKEISGRLLDMVDADMGARICPEAYDKVDTRNLTKPPGRSLTGLALMSVLLLIAIIIGYIAFFDNASSSLRQSLDSIPKAWAADNSKEVVKPGA
jgi:type VI protein secretion system component VasF